MVAYYWEATLDRDCYRSTERAKVDGLHAACARDFSIADLDRLIDAKPRSITRLT